MRTKLLPPHRKDPAWQKIQAEIELLREQRKQLREERRSLNGQHQMQIDRHLRSIRLNLSALRLLKREVVAKYGV